MMHCIEVMLATLVLSGEVERFEDRRLVSLPNLSTVLYERTGRPVV